MIDRYRHAIDEIDLRIVELLNERFRACEGIGREKKKNGIVSVQDPAREQAIIDNLSNYEEWPGMVGFIWPIIFKYSRDLQERE